ncbi:MAG: AAA family ATPase, partial [Armatimonadota bacterium]
VGEGGRWDCGIEFDYANEESFYCRPLRIDVQGETRMPIPPEASGVQVAFLPPMSGLAREEPVLERGRIDVLVGEGQTAQVLRNLCYQIFMADEQHERWESLAADMTDVFGMELEPPNYVAERGEITMSYRTRRGTRLDISSSGRGCQQTLLVLAHLYANPGTVLLIDEPDAHLEILRQRQVYQLITEVAREHSSQIIAASHSEVLLNEAADRDTVVAFVGEPHRIDDRGSQALKALKDIGFDQYYQAQYAGWVLYLEGATDLAILRALAQKLGHPASAYLSNPFVHYVGNQPGKACEHFFGLDEAKPDLVGFGVFDRDVAEEQLQPDGARGLVLQRWEQREIENYVCTEEVLLRFARRGLGRDLFADAQARRNESVMREAVDALEDALQTLGHPSPWSRDLKVTDEFLDRLFENYFDALDLPNLMRKTDYHQLVEFLGPEEIDPDIVEKLDAIVEVAERARGAGLPGEE